MLTVLDLCCGTGSVGASFKRVLGDDVTIISLDLLPKFRPTIVAGILTWDYKSLQLEGPLVIWGSPPCTEYSKAKTVGYRNLRLADAIAKKVFEIIDHFKPSTWFVENPRGMLRHRPFMARYSALLRPCSYCKYGFLYRKATDLWTNSRSLRTLDICYTKNPCRHRTDGRHTHTAQRGPTSTGSLGCVVTRVSYAVPEALMDVLLFHLNV